MDWYRTDADVIRHPHFLLLVRKLKSSRPVTFGHLHCLWACVAEHAETGHLKDTPDEVIEEWAEWPADRAGEFVAALRSSGWLTSENVIAGWPKRHAAIFKARENSSKGPKKPIEPESKASRSLLEAEPKPVDSQAEAASKAMEPTVQCSTSPCNTSPTATSAAPVSRQPEVEKLFAVYLEATDRRAAALTDKAAARLSEMLAWAGSVEAAERGIRKVGASAHHRGHNEQRKRYDALDDKPFRTRESFRGWCEEPVPTPTPAARSRSILDAVRAIRQEEESHDRA